ncbi:vacuolar protein sorting-associated protein 72 homolog [Pristis pectinata]|uniref:vacuolar protein sorting-associated protein 72 homolog n=1 Tax=Pristis pectinata TaxID=685728 RepID=UPI00223CC310|nr:vacuolar protein sorting-associated protein 72 homolog [Pristis pectinata]
MSLAENRPSRKNAGNRMSRLLEAEEDDDFYKTTYGGFHEESGDDEYNTDQSESEDEVDSDFDIDEGDEPASDQEDDEPRRKRRVITKVYKEPVKSSRPKPKPRKSLSTPGTSEKAYTEKGDAADLPDEFGEYSRKSVRQSTTEHTRLTYLRVQERQVQPRRLRKAPHAETHQLSQEELLAEAKITEEINLRSLENYERLEADKKRQVLKKRRCVGPTIRFHSVTMPLVTEISVKEENVDVEGLDHEPQPTAEPSQTPVLAPVGRCLRNFITFSDDATFERAFPKARPPKVPARELCPVTHKPALYRDPITDIPYANTRAFKIIREAYKKYITAHGLPSNQGGAQPEQISRSRQRIIIKQAAPTT